MRTYFHQCKKCTHMWSSHGESHMACPVCKLNKVQELIDQAEDWQETCCKIYDEINNRVDEDGVIHSDGG